MTSIRPSLNINTIYPSSSRKIRDEIIEKWINEIDNMESWVIVYNRYVYENLDSEEVTNAMEDVNLIYLLQDINKDVYNAVTNYIETEFIPSKPSAQDIRNKLVNLNDIIMFYPHKIYKLKKNNKKFYASVKSLLTESVGEYT